jgi:hypothetical protein
MPKRQHKISKGTIGSLRCEISLNKILIEAGDAHLTGRVMSVYHRFCLVMKKIQKSNLENNLKRCFMGLYRDSVLEIVDRRQLPKVVDSHVRCCINAQYKMALPRGDRSSG